METSFCLYLHHLFFVTVFRPISADAKLRMNPRSDVDFSSPKVDLMVNLSEVAIELNRPQVSVPACVHVGVLCINLSV